MAGLNLCDCGKNFTGMTAFNAHRAGDYTNRRCCTSGELTVKGWTMTVEPVTRRREGVPYIDHLETWSIPMDEKAKAYFASLNKTKVEDIESEEGEE